MIFWRSIKNYRKLKKDESVDIALKQIKEKEKEIEINRSLECMINDAF